MEMITHEQKQKLWAMVVETEVCETCAGYEGWHMKWFIPKCAVMESIVEHGARLEIYFVEYQSHQTIVCAYWHRKDGSK